MSETDRGPVAPSEAGLFTVQEVVRLLTMRHIEIPEVLRGRTCDEVLHDEDLAKALRFESAAQAKQAAEWDAAHGQEPYKDATALFIARASLHPIVTRWRDQYEADLIDWIQAGKLQAIDRELWRARVPYRGAMTGMFWQMRLLVSASQVDALEAARGSTLAPIADKAVSGGNHTPEDVPSVTAARPLTGDTSSAGITRKRAEPLQRSTAQRELILTAIAELGWVPTQLPPQRAGLPGPRSAVRGKLEIPSATFTTVKAFDNAWSRLLAKEDGTLGFAQEPDSR